MNWVESLHIVNPSLSEVLTCELSCTRNIVAEYYLFKINIIEIIIIHIYYRSTFPKHGKILHFITSVTF